MSSEEHPSPYTYVLAKLLQNGAKFIQNWLQISKIIWGIWITSDKQWKVQKFKIQSATFVGKNTFLQLKHYIQRIYLTLLSTTYVKLHQIPLVIFKNHKTFFPTQLVCIILAHTWDTFDKNIPSKCKFSLYMLWAKLAHQSANFQIFHCSH